MTPRVADAQALPLGRGLGFFLTTAFAFGLDAMVVIPAAGERQGAHWTAFGVWDTTVLQFCLAMAAAYSVLLLRRRFPLSTLAVISALSLVLTAAWSSGQPVVGVLVSLFSAAVAARRRWEAWLALAIGVTALSTGMLMNLGARNPDIDLAVLLIGGMTFSVWLFGRREHRALVASSELPGRLAEHAQQAAAEERRRIARELHDILAHSVSAMMMQAAGAKAMSLATRHEMPAAERLGIVGQALATIETTGSQSMRELHRLLDVMRGDGDITSPEEQSSAQPSLADVAPLLDLTRHSGLHVDMFVAGAPMPLDPSVGLAAYRVVQEALTNAMRHGGRGSSVDIFQNWLPGDGLHLQVRSRTRNSSASHGSLGGGNGLYGLQERVELIGGRFEAGWADEEFVVTATLPLTPAAAPASTPASPQRQTAEGMTTSATPHRSRHSRTQPYGQHTAGASTDAGPAA